MKTTHLTILLLTIVAGTGTPSVAGPLTPPPGPVAETGRTQIFQLPFSITSPGSYVVSRNLVTGGGITIAASNVVLDLNGFQLINSGGGNSLSAITIASGVSHVAIQNGRIGGFGTPWASGISGAGATDCVVSDIQVSYTSGSGQDAAIKLGDRARVSRCTAAHGDTYAIQVGARSEVTDSRSEDCDGTGFIAGDHSVLTNCISNGNGYVTATEISIGAGSVMQGCAVGQGISTVGMTKVAVGDGGRVLNCSVRCDLPGGIIMAGNSVFISGCDLTNYRITTGTNCRIERSTIQGANASSVPALITAASGSAVTECTLTGGQAAVDMTGPSCLVDGNHIASTPLGINVHGTGSRVMRNSISAATTAISAPNPQNSNDIGPIGTAASSNSPWANLVN